MIVVLKHDAEAERQEQLIEWLKEQGTLVAHVDINHSYPATLGIADGKLSALGLDADIGQYLSDSLCRKKFCHNGSVALYHQGIGVLRHAIIPAVEDKTFGWDGKQFCPSALKVLAATIHRAISLVGGDSSDGEIYFLWFNDQVDGHQRIAAFIRSEVLLNSG